MRNRNEQPERATGTSNPGPKAIPEMTAEIPPECLQTQLASACDDLWWSSESDYPINCCWWTAAQVTAASALPSALPPETQTTAPAELVRQLAQWPAAARIATQGVEAFFARAITPQPWHNAADKAQAERLSQLQALLLENIAHCQVYRSGEVEIDVCVVGWASDGSLAGVRTKLVET